MNTQSTTTAPAIQGLQYSGQVKVSIKQGDKLITVNTGKNNGTASLFAFIANCLAGTMIQTSKPARIQLYDLDESETPNDPQTFSSPITGKISYNTTPIVKSGLVDNPNAASVTYHFLIPYGSINGNEIYKLGLWSVDTSGEDTPMAYYLFHNNAGWTPITLNEKTTTNADQNYSLIIEWTLYISNKN